MHHGLQLGQTISAYCGLVVQYLVDCGTSLKQIAYDLRCGKVVVHCVVALLAQFFHYLLRMLVALVGRRYALQIAYAVHKTFQTLLARLQGFIGEVNRATIMG